MMHTRVDRNASKKATIEKERKRFQRPETVWPPVYVADEPHAAVLPLADGIRIPARSCARIDASSRTDLFPPRR